MIVHGIRPRVLHDGVLYDNCTVVLKSMALPHTWLMARRAECVFRPLVSTPLPPQHSATLRKGAGFRVLISLTMAAALQHAGPPVKLVRWCWHIHTGVRVSRGSGRDTLELGKDRGTRQASEHDSERASGHRPPGERRPPPCSLLMRNRTLRVCNIH